MRRAAAYLSILGFIVLALPSVASALPTVRFKAAAVPIPKPGGGTYPHTGNILGAGAAVQAEYKIEGNEYDGSPPPIIGINFYLPSRTKLHPTGFPTCSKTTLEQFGSVRCPKGSAAGPIGKVIGFVTFGNERVEESAELSSFYAPGGGFLFLTDGHSPVSLEIISNAHYVNVGGAGGFGPKLVAAVPLVASVPGAPYASVKSITVKAGSAYKSRGKTIYYGTVPKACPKGGFPLKTEVIFAENGDPLTPVTVTKTYKAPCPR